MTSLPSMTSLTLLTSRISPGKQSKFSLFRSSFLLLFRNPSCSFLALYKPCTMTKLGGQSSRPNIFSSFSGERTRVVTWWPACSISSTADFPLPPVLPNTATFSGCEVVRVVDGASVMRPSGIVNDGQSVWCDVVWCQLSGVVMVVVVQCGMWEKEEEEKGLWCTWVS